MLAKTHLTPRARLFWLLFIALAPFAYLIGGLLVSLYDPIARTDFQHDRPQLVSIASRIASERGLDVANWTSFLKTGWDNSLLLYYRVRTGNESDSIERIAVPTWVEVQLRSPDGNEGLEVKLTPEGRFIGFRHRISGPASTSANGLTESESRTLAAAALAKWQLPTGSSLSGPDLREDRVQDRMTRRYTWKVKVESRPELNISYDASVVGNRLSSESFSTNLDDAFLKEHKLLRGFSLNISGRRISGLTLINLIVYYLAVAIVFIFGLYRFVQRARQREISYQRIVVLTVVIAALFLSIILITDVATYDPARNGVPLWPVYIFGTLSYVFMGLIVAVAYGSGEGDLREAYPGKLTSLDALLTGRLFSRNVARSVVVGSAFGGWALLLINVVPFLWRHQPFAGTRIENLDFIVGRLPWLSPSVVWPFDVIFTSVTGLLLPLPFLYRRFRSPRMILLVLAIYAWVAGTGAASTFTPWVGAALIGVVKAAALLVPFFKFDLLTSLVSLASTVYMTASVHIVAQPSSSLQRSGLMALGIGVAFLLVEIYFSYRGRILAEEEVGPQYAKFLAERLSLQAEVSAAREAQIRLLPQSLPQSERFAIAAECRPAHEVGGDFYEVFQLDDDRLGIFMAEGGGRGLASALSIAFAKGFLMPKIVGTTRGDDSPVEIVRSLKSKLQRTLESDENMGFVYAVVDSSDNTVRYARTGSYPRLVIGAPGDSAVSTPAESETRFEVHEKGKTTGTFTVHSGMRELADGESLLFFTDGIAAAINEEKDSVEQSLWRSISAEGLDSSAKLQKAVHSVIDASSKRAQRAGLADDLTALVVRLNP
jgi:serine phosphatase RsbU (regulator of sigma subunit)